MRVPFARFATKLKAISGLRNTSFVAYFSRTMSSSVQSIVGEDRSLVAVCQMTSTSDVESNVDTCTQLVRTAKDRGAKVVFLPEGFDYIAENKEQSLALAESLDGPRVQRMCQLAQECDVWLSLGGCHEKGPSDESKLYNAHVMIDNSGSLVAVYHKAHLFDVDVPGGPKLKESDSFIPGKELIPPVHTPVGNVGMAIDVRFPEMSLALAQQGAEILTFPSAFTQQTGLAHWEVLLRCRAIETQCYVLAAAQTGQHNAKRRSYGHSMVVDPWGCVIAQCHEGTDVCIAEIDHKYLSKVRQTMPVWSHRRTDLYGELSLRGNKKGL